MKPSGIFKIICSAVFISTALSNAQNATPAPQVDQAKPAVQVAPSNAVASGAYVDRISICLDIKENEPDVIDSVFPPNVKRLYCFTAIKGASDVSEIQHRWYYNDDLQSSISLKIGSSSWRTYSAKSIPDVYTGEWRVAIVNSKNEEVMKMVKFNVK